MLKIESTSICNRLMESTRSLQEDTRNLIKYGIDKIHLAYVLSV